MGRNWGSCPVFNSLADPLQFAAMETGGPGGFLEVPRLLESSRPAPRANLTWWMAGGFLMVVLVSGLIGNQTAGSKALVSAVWALGTIGLMGAMSAFSVYTLRR